ncbi:hypothetical protein KN815_04345 [Streptomyces sp. 4503]|uniref:Uncharacterized protein n=1 Tax=Streptomyces niphimycinicus TaxID=2842201 RepID=A0ABS6C917_9ACTN|nr:hypothetical protein [Streptomyces niphimycinicus]MBU3863347.1 hypothetical protein [Streptomyces niphimycinicus]
MHRSGAARATDIAANINRLAQGDPLGNVVRAARERAAIPGGGGRTD